MAEVLKLWEQLPVALNPLRRIKRWVIWRDEVNEDGKTTKPPYQSLKRSSGASTTKPVTWSSYDDAVDNAPKGGGIGFVLGDVYGGMDLDNCRDEEGNNEEWAQDILDRAGNSCYVELSPSGKGYHIIGLVEGDALPDGAKIVKFARGHMELYRKSPRYFTVTGDQVNQCTRLHNMDELIEYASSLKGGTKKVSLSKVVADKTRSANDVYGAIMQMMKAKKTNEQIFKALRARWGDAYKGEGWLRKDIERVREKSGIEPRAGEVVNWRIVPSSSFLSGFVPPDYLIEGLLQRRFIYSLTGKTGSGKSAITLRLSAMVGTKVGRFRIGDHEIESGCVIYFAGENPDDIRIRWTAQLDHMGMEDSDLNVNFLVGTTNIAEDIEMLKEAVARLKPDLIVIDTARAYFTGDDENDNVQMGAYARLLRQFTECGACVIVNCHPTKNAPNDNLQPVGGGAFVAEVDGNLTCTSDDMVTRLHWQTKLRGPEFAPIQFELKETQGPLKDKKGRKIKSVIASPMTEAKIELRSARTRTDLNEVLELMIAHEDGLSFAATAEHLGWTLADGRPNKARVQRLMRRLEEKRYVQRPLGFAHFVITSAGKVLARRLRRAAQRAAEASNSR